MDRLFNSGVVCTCIGVVAIGVSFMMWVGGKIDTTSLVEGCGIGLIFLRAKDSLIDLRKK